MLRPPDNANVVGLALSGGGIRSACLGVLQALDRAEVLDSVDYMSTVSGGGYVGCSLTAALESTGEFPFASRLEEDEPPALQQIRNYSNYLFPNGARDLLANGSIYAHGLVINAVLLAPFLLVASALTLRTMHGATANRVRADPASPSPAASALATSTSPSSLPWCSAWFCWAGESFAR